MHQELEVGLIATLATTGEVQTASADIPIATSATSELIDVTDRGTGIPHEDQRMIFEKFGRVRNQDSKPGTGLGLYIARSIAEAHGGTLDVSSAPGLGSTFTLSVPVAV